MNSLFGPVHAMAKTFRLGYGLMTIYALFGFWNPGETLIPWAALYFWVHVFVFQSIENGALEQAKQWNDYLGKEEHELLREGYR